MPDRGRKRLIGRSVDVDICPLPSGHSLQTPLDPRPCPMLVERPGEPLLLVYMIIIASDLVCCQAHIRPDEAATARAISQEHRIHDT